MADISSNMLNRKRIHFLDNLRTFMIFLVVVNHSGWVYENSGIGAFFWIVDDPVVNGFAGPLNLIIDIFVMSVIFYISGCLAPFSLKTKGAWVFIKTKFKRLMIPWILSVFTLIPLYKVMFLWSRGLPQDNWTTYFHFTNGNWSQNWLWFLPVLFLFSVIFALLSRILVKVNTLKHGFVLLLVFITGFTYSVSMELLDLHGWTKTFLVDFQNERVLIYFIMFILGTYHFDRNLLVKNEINRKVYFAALLTVSVPVVTYRTFYLQSFVFPGEYIFSELFDALVKWGSFHLSLLLMLYINLAGFNLFFNKQGSIGKELSRNSYNVYIIHVIVLGVFAALMLDSSLSSLIKNIILIISTYITCNLIVSLYQRNIKPLLRF